MPLNICSPQDPQSRPPTSVSFCLPSQVYCSLNIKNRLLQKTFSLEAEDMMNTSKLCNTNTSIMKSYRVRHACHVYFYVFATYPHVVSISMLSCPCNIVSKHCLHLNAADPTYS